NFVYDFPQIGRNGVIGTVLNGWQMNGVLTLSSGTPFTVTDSNTAQTNAMRRASNTPNLVTNGTQNPVTGNPDAWFDVNTFIPSVSLQGVYYNGNSPVTPTDNPKLSLRDNVTLPERRYHVRILCTITRTAPTGTCFN